MFRFGEQQQQPQQQQPEVFRFGEALPSAASSAGPTRRQILEGQLRDSFQDIFMYLDPNTDFVALRNSEPPEYFYDIINYFFENADMYAQFLNFLQENDLTWNSWQNFCDLFEEFLRASQVAPMDEEYFSADDEDENADDEGENPGNGGPPGPPGGGPGGPDGGPGRRRYRVKTTVRQEQQAQQPPENVEGMATTGFSGGPPPPPPPPPPPATGIISGDYMPLLSQPQEREDRFATVGATGIANNVRRDVGGPPGPPPPPGASGAIPATSPNLDDDIEESYGLALGPEVQRGTTQRAHAPIPPEQRQPLTLRQMELQHDMEEAAVQRQVAANRPIIQTGNYPTPISVSLATPREASQGEAQTRELQQRFLELQHRRNQEQLERVAEHVEQRAQHVAQHLEHQHQQMQQQHQMQVQALNFQQALAHAQSVIESQSREREELQQQVSNLSKMREAYRNMERLAGVQKSSELKEFIQEQKDEFMRIKGEIEQSRNELSKDLTYRADKEATSCSIRKRRRQQQARATRGGIKRQTWRHRTEKIAVFECG